MTKQLNPSQLSEDYISAHLPFKGLFTFNWFIQKFSKTVFKCKGRSASQVLQPDSTLSSVKLWGKRSLLKCRLRCVYSCLDLAHGLKTVGRSTKVSDSNQQTNQTTNKRKVKTNSQKWKLWKRFFSFKPKEEDVMTRKEVTISYQITQTTFNNLIIFWKDFTK